jgi:hypothetical protein
MQDGTGELLEIYLDNGLISGRIVCRKDLIPAPGQYLLAHDPSSEATLPLPLFNAGPLHGGFRAAAPIPEAWRPGTKLFMRGPLGMGFSMPTSARRVALLAMRSHLGCLRALLEIALGQGAAVALVSGSAGNGEVPPEVEIRPLAALAEAAAWADYVAVDLWREDLPDLRELLGEGMIAGKSFPAQVFVGTDMPCGGMAECGVCALPARRSWRLACKDGPVFDLVELI